MHNFENTSFDNVWRYILAHFVHAYVCSHATSRISRNLCILQKQVSTRSRLTERHIRELEGPTTNIAGMRIHGSNGKGRTGDEEPPTCCPVSTQSHIHGKLDLPSIYEDKDVYCDIQLPCKQHLGRSKPDETCGSCYLTFKVVKSKWLYKR